MNAPPIRHFLSYLELYLSALGLLMILFLPPLTTQGRGNIWQVSAMTAVCVALLDGLILWAIHRRQRAMRRQVINEIQVMLQDLVRNRIAMLMVDTYSATRDPSQREESLARINQTIQLVLDILDTLSEESLRTWQTKYGDIARRRE